MSWEHFQVSLGTWTVSPLAGAPHGLWLVADSFISPWQKSPPLLKSQHPWLIVNVQGQDSQQGCGTANAQHFLSKPPVPLYSNVPTCTICIPMMSTGWRWGESIKEKPKGRGFLLYPPGSRAHTCSSWWCYLSLGQHWFSSHQCPLSSKPDLAQVGDSRVGVSSYTPEEAEKPNTLGAYLYPSTGLEHAQWGKGSLGALFLPAHQAFLPFEAVKTLPVPPHPPADPPIRKQVETSFPSRSRNTPGSSLAWYGGTIPLYG